nr:sucrose transport protein SUC3 isoform X1 [Tanacetum cinerariifolium]
MDTISIRVPYKNLKHDADAAEVEMINHEEEEANLRIESDHSNGNVSASVGESENCSVMTLILSCTVAAGVQFGWALQLSLLTPYIQ